MPRGTPLTEIARLRIHELRSAPYFWSVDKIYPEVGYARSTVALEIERANKRDPGTLVSRVRQYPLNEGYFDIIDTPEKAYWLGFLAGDGCVHPTHYATSVSLMASDRSHLEKLRQSLQTTIPVHEYHYPARIGAFVQSETHIAKLVIGSKRLMSDIIRHGVTPRKSLNLKPWTAVPELSRDWYRGLFDADGSIYVSPDRKRWGVSLCSGSRALIEHFAGWVFSRTGRCRQVATSRQPYKGQLRPLYSVGVCGPHVATQLASLLYENSSIYLDRKFELHRHLLDYCQTAGRSPHAIPKGEYAEIVHLYTKECLTLQTIGFSFGVGPSTIARILDRCDIKRRPPCAIRRDSPALPTGVNSQALHFV